MSPDTFLLVIHRGEATFNTFSTSCASHYSSLNQPRLNRITRSTRKKGGVLWRAPRTTMVGPKVSPEQTCMLGRFSVVHMGELAHKSTHTTGLARGSSLPTSQPNSVKRVSLEPLPPVQPRVVIPYLHIS